MTVDSSHFVDGEDVEYGRSLAALIASQMTRATGSAALEETGARRVLVRAVELASRSVSERGCRLEILRSNASSLVVRATAVKPETRQSTACQITRGLLGELSRAILGFESVLVETRCQAWGSPRCLFAVVWDDVERESALGPDKAQSTGGELATAGIQSVPGNQLGPVSEISEENESPVEVRFVSTHEIAPREIDAFSTEATFPGDSPPPPVPPPPPILPPPPVARLSAGPAGRRPIDPRIIADLIEAPAAAREVGEQSPDLDDGGDFDGDSNSGKDEECPVASRGHRRHILPPWARRRALVVIAIVLAGALGGVLVTLRNGQSYGAKALMVVRSGTAHSAPGDANDATTLAITYAALIPSDTTLRSVLARRLSVAPETLGSSISATAESGTALIELSFSASSPAVAEQGANDLASILSARRPPGSAIVPRSMAVVTEATNANRSGESFGTGLGIGAALGLLIGLILALLLERIDSRVDSPEDLAASCGCPAAEVPGGLSIREIAVALSRAAPDRAVTVVPLSSSVAGPAARLARLLGSWWPGAEAMSNVDVSGPYNEEPWHLTEGAGPTLLVAASGERSEMVGRAADRLRLLGRASVFAVLCRQTEPGGPGESHPDTPLGFVERAGRPGKGVVSVEPAATPLDSERPSVF